MGSGDTPASSIRVSTHSLYCGLVGSSSHTIEVSVISRYGNCTPGSGCTPKKKSNPNVPEGVRPSPSVFVSGAAKPWEPMLASQGPNASCHSPPDSFVGAQGRRRLPVVARGDDDHLVGVARFRQCVR